MPSLGNVFLISTMSLTLAACSGTPTASHVDASFAIESNEVEMIAIGSVAPDFTLDTIDGTTISLNDFRGRVVVLDFWTTWCLGCVQEVPIMNEFANWADQQELPITVIAVNTYPNKDQVLHLKQVRSYLADNDIDMMVGLDPSGTPVARDYGVRSFPSNVIINSDGVVTATGVGMKHPYLDWLKNNSFAAMNQP
ncbi:MAG: TlpA disulfide reductase family protein [Phycisphaerales bacterium]|nr:TlpA disulfide reductase family protein [Phycisphaerales bacterium]